jgi:hypothetical protein
LIPSNSKNIYLLALKQDYHKIVFLSINYKVP